jgi:hypothetical protein
VLFELGTQEYSEELVAVAGTSGAAGVRGGEDENDA